MSAMFWGYSGEIAEGNAAAVPVARRVRALLLDVMDNAVVEARRRKHDLAGYSAYQADLATEALARLEEIMGVDWKERR